MVWESANAESDCRSLLRRVLTPAMSLLRGHSYRRVVAIQWVYYAAVLDPCGPYAPADTRVCSHWELW